MDLFNLVLVVVGAHVGLFVLLIGIFIVLLFYWENSDPRHFPKGPFRFPLLGNIPQLLWKRSKNVRRHKVYADYAKEYGPIYSVKLASFKAVVLTDPKLIKEAWNNYNLCGRPKLHGAAERTGGIVRGILFQDGLEWLEQRRFALRHLKDFGFGKRSMETLVMDEALELIEGFKRDCDAETPIPTQNRFNIAVLNSLWSIVSGQRFSHEDKQLKDIMDSIQRTLNLQGIVFFIPWLKDVAPKWSGWDDYVKEVPRTTEFVRKLVRQRLDSYDATAEPQDFTDVYMHEIHKTKDKNSSFFGKRGEETLAATLLDLFVAGAETTSTTLTYVFLYLTMFPEKQEKLHEEIDRVLGSRNPTLEERIRMPYTEAVIQETLRFSAMVPLGIMHKALEDTILDKYVIPRDTWLIANLHAVHHSPEIWGDPQNFRPERFIDDSGRVIRHEALLAFSYGKRVCLGETLARDELFLFITALFQKFQTEEDKSPDAEPLTTEQLATNIITPPKPHKLILKIRTPSNN